MAPLGTKLGILASSGTAAAGYLLDDYSDASGAWSAARKLSDDSIYSGPCMEVYEDSGTTVADIGFDGDGNLDEAALLAHTGTGVGDHGMVKTLYDQSGNGNDLIVPTATVGHWPFIVDDGAIQKVNGKPTVRQNADGTGFLYTTSGITGSVVWQFSVQELGPEDDPGSDLIWLYFAKPPGEDAYYMKMYKNSATDSFQWIGGVSAGKTGKAASCEMYKNGSGTPITNWDNAGDLWDEMMPLVTAEQSLLTFSDLNLTTVLPWPPGSDWQNGIRFGHNSYPGWPYALQEQIMWESDQASNKAGIESNINTYYSIY